MKMLLNSAGQNNTQKTESEKVTGNKIIAETFEKFGLEKF